MENIELFLHELDGRGFEFKDKSYTEFGFNDEILNMVYEMWSASVPDGYYLTKKRNTIGNSNVDFSQAPDWAKFWLKDGYSNKFWWSSKKPTKDMDMDFYCWSGNYRVEEAPSFGYVGEWHKSMTSKSQKEKSDA